MTKKAPKAKSPPKPAAPKTAEPAAVSPAPPAVPAEKLTPEEQMERFAKELKNEDWGHQPC